MPSLVITSIIHTHAVRRNVAIIAHQRDCTMENPQLLLSARTVGPLLLVRVQVLAPGQSLGHAMVKRHNILLDSPTRSDSLGVNQPCSCRFLAVGFGNSMLVRHQCATESWAKTAQADLQVLPLRCLSDTARQTQVHESGYAIHRLMPPNRTINFTVDRNSFRLNGVPDEATDIVIASAEEIASFIQKQNLGINFAHMPTSGSDTSTVFEIRYDPSLGPRTLAQSFLPSDPRTKWKLGISQSVVTSQCNLLYLPNILAHEFAHVLGLCHWNARTHETRLRSFHWPNTRRDSPRSVMVTDVHPSEILFSAEDFRVIREMYSLANGHVLAGREIVDVYP